MENHQPRVQWPSELKLRGFDAYDCAFFPNHHNFATSLGNIEVSTTRLLKTLGAHHGSYIRIYIYTCVAHVDNAPGKLRYHQLCSLLYLQSEPRVDPCSTRAQILILLLLFFSFCRGIYMRFVNFYGFI